MEKRDFSLVINFLSNYTNGVVRRELLGAHSYFTIRSILDPGYLDDRYISRVANVIFKNPDLLNKIQKVYMWF